MLIDENFFLELDTKVYNFTIHVISFIKSIEKMGLYESNNVKLMKLAGDLAVSFPDFSQLDKSLISQKLEEIHYNANSCFKLLQKVDCKNKLINEKSNLLIEVKIILKDIETILPQFKMNE